MSILLITYRRGHCQHQALTRHLVPRSSPSQEAKEYASKFLSKDWGKFIDPSAELEAAADKDEWPWNEPGDLPEAYL